MRNELFDATQALARLRSLDAGDYPAAVTREWLAGWETARKAAEDLVKSEGAKFAARAASATCKHPDAHDLVSQCCWVFGNMIRIMRPSAAGKPAPNFGAMPHEWKPIT